MLSPENLDLLRNLFLAVAVCFVFGLLFCREEYR